MVRANGHRTRYRSGVGITRLNPGLSIRFIPPPVSSSIHELDGTDTHHHWSSHRGLLMPAYNEVVRTDEEVCPRCHSKIHRTVQFKYGDVWQHRYVLGDKLEWGGNDVGEAGHRLVIVVGYPGECPVCGHAPEMTYDITLRDDVIDVVQPSDGTYEH